MVDIVCVIVTYNRVNLLKKVVTSVLMQDYPISKILIIDNASVDETFEVISEMAENNTAISYHNTGGNLGGAGGFNFGFKVAEKYKYDYLWIMDDDLVPEPDCLSQLIATNNNGITQPLRLNLDGSFAELSPITYNLSNPFYLSPKRKSVIDVFKDKHSSDLIEIQGIPFEGPLISKDVIDTIGYPNLNFFIFYDDLDYAIRARKNGFKIICNPSAKAIRQLKNNQTNDLKSWKGYFMLRNLFHIHYIYGNNIFVKLKPLLLVTGLTLSSLLRLELKMIKVIFSSYLDSFKLKNTDKHKP